MRTLPMAFFATGRRGLSVMAMTTMMTAVFEEFFEAVAKSLSFLLIFLNNFLNLEQVMVMLNLFLTVFAKTELRTGRTFIPDANDGLREAALALSAFMNQSLWINLLDLLI
jgi:hypothetical protein